MALLVDELSGPGRRCPGADGDELVGLLRAWAAIESWAAGGKLGVIREIMRREGPPSPGADHGGLPETWSAVAALRAVGRAGLLDPVRRERRVARLAAGSPAAPHRRPAGGRDAHQPKARAITETFEQLTDPDAAAAEALIADQLAGKTYTQVLRLAEQAALTVDPELAERRREHAQKNYARVSFFREQAGTAGLSGRDLPPDEALAAMAAVNARAEQYKESDAFGDTPMDVLRARAYLDLINGSARRRADRARRTARRRRDAQRGPGVRQPRSRGAATEPTPGPRPTISSRPGRPGQPGRLPVRRVRRQLPAP